MGRGLGMMAAERKLSSFNGWAGAKALASEARFFYFKPPELAGGARKSENPKTLYYTFHSIECQTFFQRL